CLAIRLIDDAEAGPGSRLAGAFATLPIELDRLLVVGAGIAAMAERLSDLGQGEDDAGVGAAGRRLSIERAHGRQLIRGRVMEVEVVLGPGKAEQGLRLARALAGFLIEVAGAVVGVLGIDEMLILFIHLEILPQLLVALAQRFVGLTAEAIGLRPGIDL